MVFLSSVSRRLVSLSFLLLLLSYSATASPYPRRTYSRSPIRFAEELIRDLNLLPWIPEAEADGEAGDGDPSSPRLVERRLDLPILGDIGSEISIEQLGHHAGYYRLEHTHAAKMFYFFFESRGKSSDPVVIWLTGGPGCSSELALFYENGPFKIADNMSLIWNNYGWDKASNLIFVDQPTGTGFSYSTDLRDIRYGEKRIADDLYDFLQAFFKEHQDYLKNDFYITGESYAGHYIPAAAERVYRGNKEKQGFHINLKVLLGQYHALLLILFVIPSSLQFCFSLEISIIMILGENVRGSLCYDFSNMEKFLNDKSVRKALGVGDRNFVSCNPLVYEAMLTDWMKNLEVGIPALVDDGIKLLVYAGEYDLICNWLGNFRWVNSMEWSGHQIFAEAPMSPFTVDGKEAGQLKAYGPLSFLKVHDAGHMVPMDQPRAALEMLKRWMNGSLSEEWKFSAA